MATANSRLKIDYGFDSYGSSNVTGDMRVSGNLVVNGTLSYTGTSTSDWIPASDQLNLGNTVNRWNLIGYTANVASTLTVTGSTSLQDTLTVTKTIGGGNTTINGWANASVSVNSALLTVGTSFIANTSGTYHSGVINAASHTTSGFVANTTAITPTSNTILLGNSIGRFVISANTGNFSGDVTVTGNTTVNNATLNGTVQTIAGNVNFDAGTLFVDSVNNRVGINNTAPTVALEISGSANVTTSVNSASFTIGSSLIANTTGAYHTGVINAASHTVGSSFIANSTTVTTSGSANLTALDSTIRIGNSTVNALINSTAVSIGTGNFGTGANVGANVNLTNTSLLIGNSTVNSSITNSLVRISNATSTANLSPLDLTLGQTVVNSSMVYVSTGTFTASANVGSNVFVNTSTLLIGNSTVNSTHTSSLLRVVNSTSSANLSPGDLVVGGTVVNSSVINAASFTVGSGFVANTVGIISNNFISNSVAVAVAPVLAIRGGGATAEGGQIVLGYGNNLATAITGQANNTFNLDIVGGNTATTPVFRAFFINNDGTTTNAFIVANTGKMHVGSLAEQTDSTFKVTGTANVTTSVNSALLTVGSSFIANTIGVYTTGVVNAASLQVSNSLSVNSTTTLGANINGDYFYATGQYQVGSWVNSTSYAPIVQISTVGISILSGFGLTASTLSINGGDFYANSSVVNAVSLNINSGSFIANGTGAYHTGVINAASHTVGSNFIANTTAVVITKPLTANGSTGTSGQLLASNGSTGSPYWTTTTSVSITDDTTTNGSRYLLFANQTSSTLSTAYVSSTKLSYNPSTGTLSSTVMTGSSDERLKTNIETIADPVDTLSKLRGVSFNRIDNNHKDYGVIAQEIEKILPDVVYTDADGYKTVSYNSIIGFLIEAVKKQQEQIDILMQDKYPK